MFKNPNDMLFESKQGQGNFIFKGRIKGERIEATSLSAPELDSISSQIEEIRGRIRALSVQPLPTTQSSSSTTPHPPSPSVEFTHSDDVLREVCEIREQVRSADLPGILSQMDEIRASIRACNVVAPAAIPQVSIQQLSKLQDQVTRLVGQMNTLQDRVSIIEGRVRLMDATPTPTSTATSNMIESISDVASAAASAAAGAVVNRAAMKLEDMVSPGALYNLRKVSERGPVRYAW